MQYILLITETSDLAADLLVLSAKQRRIPVIRFNQDEFPQRICVQWRGTGQSRFSLEKHCFAEDEVSGAWFRRAPRTSSGKKDDVSNFVLRESDGYLKGIWETTSWLWMNFPSAVARAELKLLQLRHAQQIGLKVPDTLVTNCPEATRSFAEGRNVIAKTVVGGGLSIDGIGHAIFTTAVTSGDLDIDSEIQACPLTFQNRIPVQYDLRVTVVGDSVFAARVAVRDRNDSDVDWRGLDPARLHYERDSLPQEIEIKCRKLVAAFGLMYGALDFVVTPDGEYVFLELNPSGQWVWLERRLRMPITDTILDILVGNSHDEHLP